MESGEESRRFHYFLGRVMGTIDYYHRYDHDGNCETICTRCFATLGRTKDLSHIKLLEEAHACAMRPHRLKLEAPRGHERARRSSESTAYGNPFRHLLGKMGVLETLLSLCSIFVCLYLLPNVIELELMKHANVWSSCILFGDLAGCFFLSIGLGLKKTGILLYASLTGCEGWLYAARIVSPHELMWITDLGPTLVVAGLIVYFSVQAPPRCHREL